MNRSYVIMSKEKGSYEKFSEMIRKDDPKSRVMRVRDASEAYNVARIANQPIVVIDIEQLSAADEYTGYLSSGDDGKNARERLGELKRYITLNLDKHLSLVDLSRKMYITPNYLSSIFRKYENVTLIQFIEGERMRKAKFLLETQKNSHIRDVGREVGYESCAYFSRTFKKHYGITPLRFQKNHWLEKAQRKKAHQ